MSDFSSLSGQLLISLPTMQGDYFSHTVTLLIEHNPAGAFGLVVNHPPLTELTTLLAHEGYDFDPEMLGDLPLCETGPVEQQRLFFLHSAEVSFENSFAINEKVTLSTSLDLVEAIVDQRGPRDVLAGLGYAGWSGGQLEQEIADDVWLVTPYLHDAVFNTPYDERPGLAASAIGIDLILISPNPGHG